MREILVGNNIGILLNDRLLIIKTMVAKRRYFYWIMQIYICCVKSVQSKHFEFWSVVCFVEKNCIYQLIHRSIFGKPHSFSYSKHHNILLLSEFFISVWTEYASFQNNNFMSVSKNKQNSTLSRRIQSVTGLYRTMKPLCARRSKRDTISVYNLTESIRSFFQQW